MGNCIITKSSINVPITGASYRPTSLPFTLTDKKAFVIRLGMADFNNGSIFSLQINGINYEATSDYVSNIRCNFTLAIVKQGDIIHATNKGEIDDRLPESIIIVPILI